MPDDRDSADLADVCGEAVDVRRDDSGARVQGVTADQAGNGYLAEGLGEVLDHSEDTDVHAAGLDVSATAGVHRHAGVVEDPRTETSLLGDETLHERAEANRAVVVRERDGAIGERGVAREREHRRPRARVLHPKLRQLRTDASEPAEVCRPGAGTAFGAQDAEHPRPAEVVRVSDGLELLREARLQP